LAILGGIGPAMLWLWFWLKEDRLHPEPKALLTRVFLFGGLAVFPTYFIQQFLHIKLSSFKEPLLENIFENPK
jgi:RsiW-degrading membrane proteinase PrsW (M82 family)